MSYQPHYIASFEDDSGLNTYYEPFLIPEKAFPQLEDAYAWRGKIRRRDGFKLLGRLRRSFTTVSIGNSGASPWSFNLYATLAAPIGPITGEPQAEIETAPLTVPDAIANRLTITIGAIVFTDQGDGALLSVTPGNSGTIDYLTGDITITTTAIAGTATTISFAYFPTLPVMGLPDDVTTLVNEQNLRAFDTKYAYQFVAGNFVELPATTPTTWHGSDSDLFWTINYWHPSVGSLPLMWTTNFYNSTTNNFDPLRYYDGTDWTTFTPDIITGTNKMYTCRALIPYKDRLLAFNTWEGTTVAGQKGAKNFPQRLRYSEIGSPILADAWVTDVKGKGGFIDVTSDEQIVSVEFIKDVLVVKLERSSWKVVYTGNKILPFLFEKINTELGAESTFSLVPFDRGIFSVGNVGILTDDSVNVYRIDQKIPQVVFGIRNADNGPKRVYGIRDFSNELVYWTFPSSALDRKFPNQVLVYNYINQTYAIFNDSFTCYGYYQKTSNDVWGSYTTTTWEGANFAWNSGVQQARYPDIVAGNQQGFVEVLNKRVQNDVNLAINDITPNIAGTPVLITSVDHNMSTGQFIKITGIIGTGSPNPTVLNDEIYKVFVIDKDTFNIQLPPTFDNVELLPGGTYLGGGKITQINNFNVITKVFAPFYEQGGQARLGYIDFLLDKTDAGEIACNVFVDECQPISISDPIKTSGLLGTNIVLTSPENITLIPYQANQDKIWHRFFVQSIAQNFQLQFFMNDEQMSNEMSNSSPFVLHAMTLYISKNARMTQ